MDTRIESVRVLARSGGAAEGAELTVRSLGAWDRALGAAKVLGLGILLAAVVLPIPLVHLFAIPVAGTAIWLAARRVRTADVVARAEGRCPACGARGRFFVGFGRRRFRLPIATSCAACAADLTLAERD